MALQFLSSSPMPADGVDEPIFIVASERSGTTLLRLMLDGHPRVTWCHEFSYVVDLMGDNGEPPDLDRYYKYLDTDRVFGSSGFAVDPALDYIGLVNSFLRQRMATYGGSTVGANVHRHASKLPLLWPNARYIHLVRDGRDVADSCIRKGWFGSYWHAGNHWLSAEREWDLLSAKIAPERRLEITFEELVANPEATIQKLCAFIGIAYDDDFFRAYQATTDYEPVDKSRIGSWRGQLTDDDVGLVEGGCADMLERRGYELSGVAIPELGAADLHRLDWRDRRGRIQARLAVFGFWLTVAELATRLLRFRPLWRRAKLRMNQIEVRGLKKSWS